MNTISAELFPPKRASEDNRQYAYRVLQSAVIRFDFGPGTRLSESELARLLEVSRTPVHDALERLEREHLLESAPSRGFTVRTLNKQRILDGIWVFNIFSTEIIHHFYLNRIPKEEIKILLYLIDTANKALDTTIKTDSSVHLRICSCSFIPQVLTTDSSTAPCVCLCPMFRDSVFWLQKTKNTQEN